MAAGEVIGRWKEGGEIEKIFVCVSKYLHIQCIC